MSIYIVYMHTSVTTGKSYIGYTSKSLEKRFQGHLYETKYGSNGKFHNAIRKYGSHDFISKILYITFSKDAAKNAEIELIQTYNTFENGYNMTKGGDDLAEARRIRPRKPHSKAISITIDGVYYPSLKKACKYLQMRADTLLAYRNNPGIYTNIFDFNKSRKCICPVTIDGIDYKSLAEASKKIKISIPLLRRYLKESLQININEYIQKYRKETPVVIDNISYKSKAEACRNLNITKYKLNSLL